jgi:hypothetical protein
MGISGQQIARTTKSKLMSAELTTVEIREPHCIGLPPIYKLAPSTSAASTPRHYEIIANGNNVTVKLNSMLVAELQMGTRRTKGFIALKNHHPGKVQFRTSAYGMRQ